MIDTVRIATRKSPLALWQAEFVKAALQAHYPTLTIHLVPMSTQGDLTLDQPLAKIGGKGLFVKELQRAMEEDRADIAVHSMKDVGVDLPAMFEISCVLATEDPLDAFVSNHYQSLADLPHGAVVGTSSLRRQSQLLAHHPELEIRFLRGNVNTRLSKLDAGEYDAIILAAAGLKRLGLQARIRNTLSEHICLPAVGQGVMGIECLSDRTELKALLAPLEDTLSRDRIEAERAMSRRLNGSCETPIAAHAVIEQQTLWLRGRIGDPDGSELLCAELRGPREQASEIGRQVAESLIAQGANQILQRYSAR